MASSPSRIRHCHLLSLLLLLLAISPYSATSLKLSYADHCDSVVPHAAPARRTDYSYTYISLSNGFLSGGDKLLAPDEHSSSYLPSSPGYFYFYSQNFYPTRTPGVLKFEGSLTLQGPTTSFLYNVYTNSSRHHRQSQREIVRSYPNRKMVNLALTGYWSKPLGKICMVGSGYVDTDQGIALKPTAVFKLNYPQISNISTSLVNGSVESLDAPDSPMYFDPISLLVYAQNNYTYTKIPQAMSTCSNADAPKQVLEFGERDAPGSTCNNLLNMLNGWFELERGNPCFVLNCSLLGFTPTFMTWNTVGCSDDGKVHMSIEFTPDTNYESRNNMQPEKSLLAEGAWDPEKNRLCLLAYPITIRKNSVVDAFIGDATIGISLWFPQVLSIESSRTIVGKIWSEKAKGSLRSYRSISFRSSDANNGYLPGTKYAYTRTDTVKRICGSSRVGNLDDGRYPDGTLIGDLRFDYSLRTDEGDSTWGSATPLSLGESFYGYSSGLFNPVLVQETPTLEEAIPVFWNVSYKLSYSYFNRSLETSTPVDITAEGIYDAATGRICMVGCRDQNNSAQYRNSNGYPMDCEILISIQLAPKNMGDGNVSFDSTRHLNGTIQSMRKKDDPLYFEPLKMSSNSMYTSEATQSIWRMDIEIIMVLVSKTLSCIFIGLQLFYIKKHSEVVSSISIAMLVILTLGHVTPLLLNFEALFFMNRNKQNVLLWSGGWLEVNEVIVRILTMLTFLLQLRLLQSAWNARSSDDNKRSLWVAERKALRFYLPLYFAGALIAWFVHTRSYRAQSDFQVYDAQHNYSIWQDLTAYGGLLLDGFLLPQIILNMIENCKEKALSPLYYVGITVVRAFPHLYNAYRTHHYVPSIDASIIYASPHEDLYSSAWDIIIPSGGAIFAVLIFIQQKFGGRCFLPKRFKGVGGYELVTVASS